MKLRHCFAAIAALTLSACAMSGFKEAPAATEYFAHLIKPSTLKTLRVLSVCSLRVQPEGVESRWYATAQLKSGSVYHYLLNLPGDEKLTASSDKFVELAFYKTTTEIEAARDTLRPPAHCLYNAEAYRIFGDSSYPAPVSVFVAESIVARMRFDDAQKQLLVRAAEALAQAADVDATQNQAAVNASWGIKP